MHTFSRIAAAAAASSLLAACAGGNAGLPASAVPAAAHAGPIAAQYRTLSTGIFTRMTDEGTVVHYYPTRSDAQRAAAAFGAVPPPAGNLLYGGGPIQPNPKVYVVFWGKLWNTTGDPDHLAPYLKSFLGGLNASQWTSTMTQYYGPKGTFINNDTVFAGSYVDTAHQPALHPTDGAIATEAKVAAAHFGDYSVNASYVVVMPHGHNPSAFGSQYCAYHSSESASGGTIAYTNLPYMPDAGQACGVHAVNTPGTLDGVSIVEGHEQGETETDPQPASGWVDAGGAEIGDKCAWIELRNTTFSTGTFPTQPLWSNKNRGCVQ